MGKHTTGGGRRTASARAVSIPTVTNEETPNFNNVIKNSEEFMTFSYGTVYMPEKKVINAVVNGWNKAGKLLDLRADERNNEIIATFKGYLQPKVVSRYKTQMGSAVARITKVTPDSTTVTFRWQTFSARTPISPGRFFSPNP